MKRNVTINELAEIIASSEATLFVLCGLPYAGKTFLAKQLVEMTSIAYVSIDTIFYKHGFDWTQNILPDAQQWKLIFDEAYDAITKALSSNKNVLYDSTNHTLASRDALRELAEKSSAHLQIIYLPISVESVWDRWQKNADTKDRPQISKELIEETIKVFEPPTIDEHYFEV
jgi:predicted kinase